MFCKTWDFKKKKYIFKLTRAAQIEIEEKQKRNQMKLFENDKLVANLILKYDSFENEQQAINDMEDGEEKEKKIDEFNNKYMPLMVEMMKDEKFGEDPIELYELGYILLKNYPKNQQLTKEEYNLLTSDMEDSLGLMETIEFFNDMHNQVFMEMEQINKVLHKKKTAPKNIPN